MSAAVFDYRGDSPLPRAPYGVDASLVLNDLAVPNIHMEIIGPNQIATERFGDVRFDALEAHLSDIYSNAAMVREVRFARDLSAAGVLGSGFVVQYRVLSYGESRSVDAGGVFAGIMGTLLTGGLTGGAFIFMATSRAEHNFTVEARLYRVEDSELVSVAAPRSGERVSQYDTSGAELVHRSIQQLKIRSGRCQVCEPSGADAEAFHREQGIQMARVIFDATAPGILEAMRTSLAGSPGVAPAAVLPETASLPSAGGEMPSSFETELRDWLDTHATRALLCMGADQAALTVEWSRPGAATLGVRGVDDPAVVECVRAAIGPLTVPPGTASGRLLHVIAQ